MLGIIKSQDYFGHTININFDKNGTSHQTYIGACLSILINLAIGYYVYSRFYMLIFHMEDVNFTNINVIDIDTNEDFQDVDYIQDTNITILHNVYHQNPKKGQSGELNINDPEVAKYINISFGLLSTDWSKDGTAEDVFQTQYFGVKECEQEDFGEHNRSKKLYEDWKDFNKLCPKLEPDEKMLLKGEESSVAFKSGLFSLKRCDTVKYPDYCKPDDEIDAYI